MTILIIWKELNTEVYENGTRSPFSCLIVKVHPLHSIFSVNSRDANFFFPLIHSVRRHIFTQIPYQRSHDNCSSQNRISSSREKDKILDLVLLPKNSETLSFRISLGWAVDFSVDSADIIIVESCIFNYLTRTSNWHCGHEEAAFDYQMFHVTAFMRIETSSCVI